MDLNTKITLILRRLSDSLILHRSKAFSLGYYQEQAGRKFACRLIAIWDYISRGHTAGLEPTPLFSTLWLKNQNISVRNLGDYLRRWKSFGGASPHPLFDPAVYFEQADVKNPKFGALEAFLSGAADSSILPYRVDRPSTRRVTFGTLRHRPMPSATLATNVGGDYLVSVIVDEVSSIARANEAIDSVFHAASGLAIEIILIPSSGKRDLFGLLGCLELTHDNVRICHRSTTTARAEVLNVAVEMAEGSCVLFMHAGHRFPVASFETLIQALDRRDREIVQPLVLNSNGLIDSAGIVFPFSEPVPVPWLRGISPAIADMPREFFVQGAQFPFMMRRREDRTDCLFNEQIGDAWLDVDLSARLGKGRSGAIEVLSVLRVIRVMKSPYEPSVLEECISEDLLCSWKSIGLQQGVPPHSTTLKMGELGHVHPATGVAGVRMLKPKRMARAFSGIPMLRWSIKTAAPSNLAANGKYEWGDTYFANSLRDALVRLGQIVTVDSVENREKPTGYLDDVVLNLRGYESIVPVQGAVNVTWVISHPDLVTVEEVKRSQLTYAASYYWAETKSNEWSTDIRPLLQCTDSRIFYPSVPVESVSDSVLFVGNAVNRDRDLVGRAIAMGVDLEIYGRGWAGRVTPAQFRGEHVDNSELRRHYATARLTINDHWPIMREWGFMSNRAFDVVASGGRVLSDKIRGLPDELVGRMAIEYNLEALIDTHPSQMLGRGSARDTRVEAAEYVLTNHTFDVRARKILDDVMSYLGL